MQRRRHPGALAPCANWLGSHHTRAQTSSKRTRSSQLAVNKGDAANQQRERAQAHSKCSIIRAANEQSVSRAAGRGIGMESEERRESGGKCESGPVEESYHQMCSQVCAIERELCEHIMAPSTTPGPIGGPSASASAPSHRPLSHGASESNRIERWRLEEHQRRGVSGNTERKRD